MVATGLSGLPELSPISFVFHTTDVDLLAAPSIWLVAGPGLGFPVHIQFGLLPFCNHLLNAVFAANFPAPWHCTMSVFVAASRTAGTFPLQHFIIGWHFT
jgi:hypothetical protein